MGGDGAAVRQPAFMTVNGRAMNMLLWRTYQLGVVSLLPRNFVSSYDISKPVATSSTHTPGWSGRPGRHMPLGLSTPPTC
jgi:hypothetical protein